MWMLIIAACFVTLFATMDIRLDAPVQAQAEMTSLDASQVANGMLLLSNAIGSYLYKNPVQNGQVDLSKLPVNLNIDRRIFHVIQDSRLWVYTSESVPALTTELQRISTNSALICVVKNGRLLMLTGADMNLTLPSGVKEGSVVYLN